MQNKKQKKCIFFEKTINPDRAYICGSGPRAVSSKKQGSVASGDYERIRGKGNRFSSTNQPANRGRKPKLYTIAKKGYNIGYDEFREVVLYLMQLSKKQLEVVTKDESTPIWVVNIARAIYKDTGKGTTATLRDLMDRMWGKAPQAIVKASDGDEAMTGTRSDFLNYAPDERELPNINEESAADE